MSNSFGKVSYVNVNPLFASGKSPDFDFFSDVPARLNNAAQEGKFDVSVVSMWIYPKLYKNYKLVPEFGVFGDGKIMSVGLYSRKPIEDLGKGRIYLTSESGSSVRAFAKICTEKYGFNPFENSESSAKNADAIFLIGNKALLQSESDEFAYSYDLGELWKSFYGTPLAYAGVVVKRELYDELLPNIRGYFERSLTKFFADKELSVRNAAAEFKKSEGNSISLKTLDEYYSRLIFRLPEIDFYKSVRVAINDGNIG